MFLSEHIQSKVITLRNFQAKISPSDQSLKLKK